MRNFKTDSVYFSFFIPAALIHSVNIYQVPALYTDLNTGYSSKQNFIQNVYVYSKGRHFFFLQEDQACATCLILACSTAACDREVSAWATRAFFRYVCPFSLVFGHFFLMDALANVVVTH